MTRIARLFETLKREHRCGMIAYLTAGDPSPEATPHFIEALERGGADLIELGVPFSDPIADGPVIQQAGDRALAAGTTLAKVLDIASTVRRRSEIPLLLFTYLNPVLRYGLESLAKDASAGGIDGWKVDLVERDTFRDACADERRREDLDVGGDVRARGDLDGLVLELAAAGRQLPAACLAPERGIQ